MKFTYNLNEFNYYSLYVNKRNYNFITVSIIDK